ncbi:hypothetical protein MVEG_00688 [Podila verticillata NRRL 6337]|nr:hypothetical protein MVEG_00688 [Podila verticillata NRRL 6337]
MEDGCQHFNSTGNIIKVPLSTDNLGQPCIYWTDIEDCFPGVLRIQDGSTFVPVVRGANGYRSSARIECERERQHQSSSIPQSPTPSIGRKHPDRQKMTKAILEASPTTSTATPMSNSLAATTTAVSATSLAEMAVWPPLFSRIMSSTSSSPFILDPSGLNLSFSFPAATAISTMSVKAPDQGSNPSTTTSSSITSINTLPESGDTKCPVTAAEATTTPEKPTIPLADRTIKTAVSLSKLSKKCRPSSISSSEDLAPEIQESIPKDEQEDEVDTATIPPMISESNDPDDMVPESPPSVQESASANPFNAPGLIGSFPKIALDTPTHEGEKAKFTPVSALASAQEERHSTISRFFGLFQ